MKIEHILSFLLSLPVNLSWPTVQWERLLSSSTQQHSTDSAKCCHPTGTMARAGKPSPSGSEPAGLLHPAGSRQGAGSLYSLSVPQDFPVALLHRSGRTAWFHFCTDDLPRLLAFSPVCKCQKQRWRVAVPTKGDGEKQAGSAYESEPVQIIQSWAKIRVRSA